jgi:predicted transglutaminase-like cysteine proteinase
MPAFIRARGIACVSVIALLAFTGAGDAAARSKGKKPHIEPHPVASAMLPETSAPAKFFTINRVLAKLDGLTGSGPVRLAAADPTAAVADAAPSPALPPVGSEPFNLFAFRAPEGQLWAKWRGVEADIARESATIAQCRADLEHCSSKAALRFIALVHTAHGLSGRARLEAVNHGVNAAIRYMSDYQQHGVADLWSAPLASLTTGLGDCEDYAIAKYVALLHAGVAPEDLRLLLVRETAIREDHAVLAARDHGHWLILDNLRAALVDDSEAKNLMPLFAIDQAGVKLLAAPYVSLEGSETDLAPAAEWGAPSPGGGALPLLM